MVEGEPILEVRGLVTRFPLRSGLFSTALRVKFMPLKNISFDLPARRNAIAGGRGPVAENRRRTRAAAVGFGRRGDYL